MDRTLFANGEFQTLRLFLNAHKFTLEIFRDQLKTGGNDKLPYVIKCYQFIDYIQLYGTIKAIEAECSTYLALNTNTPFKDILSDIKSGCWCVASDLEEFFGIKDDNFEY